MTVQELNTIIKNFKHTGFVIDGARSYDDGNVVIMVHYLAVDVRRADGNKVPIYSPITICGGSLQYMREGDVLCLLRANLKKAVLHELDEQITYKNKRIYDPHAKKS